MVADLANDLTNLERFGFDVARSFKSFGTELLHLKQLSICENHSYPVIQIVQPFPQIFIHSGTNLTDYCLMLIVSCMIWSVRVMMRAFA